jgi:SAM-dependent methyltransferase
MPTLSSGAPGSEPERAHQHRRAAESFGADAERYDRARPRYPDALVDRILAGSPGRAVLDVGCGTGIVARQFRTAGCAVLGVEPDARMAATAAGLGTEVEVATFEAWDPADRAFDALVAGQAWHWVDPAVGAAKAARVLRAAGRFAAFWNVFELPAELAQPLAATYQQVAPDAPFDLRTLLGGAVAGYAPLLTSAADGLRATGAFGEPEQWQVDWEWTYTRDAWLDQLPTLGAFTRLPAAQLAPLLESAAAAVDAMGGSFPMRYTTVAVTAARATGG